MGDRRKSKRTRSKALKEMRLKEDAISELPDPLICQILCHLPTKEAVRTSVLSTRWKTLWLWIPRLNLSFGDRFFDSTRASCLDEFQVHIGKHNDKVEVVTSRLASWIDAAAKRKIQHLSVRFLSNTHKKMPSSLYNCEKLVSLDLHTVDLANGEFVSLPCLKTLYLTDNLYPNEETFERLVSSSPVLEELVIHGDFESDAIVFRVRSVSLKSLIVSKFLFDRRVRGLGVVIDAPRLCFLRVDDSCSESYKIAKVDSSLLKLDLSLGSYGIRTMDLCYTRLASAVRRFRGFVPVMSKVRDMTLSAQMFEVLYEYSRSEPLSRFGYMSSLHLRLCVPQYQLLPTVLESFPNLKSLVLACRDVYYQVCRDFFNIEDEVCFSSVPECLLSSLEFVDFKDPVEGYPAEMKLVKYLLKNSAVLKKLTLRLEESSSAKDEIFKKLLKITRGSTQCKVDILLVKKRKQSEEVV
ncbi:unnamed protein product [Microthlaspi erraticum]|uniref:F-box domain-containing protein n=1 Tax=Microthlaspi erraticum TaxID=1685480 RepID=A0A6D2I9E0_9BRAS|nr:unnamed protein product [Microthlaspi erraticum]